MGISLSKVLHNVLIPDQQVDASKVVKYKWIYSKTDKSVKCVDASTKGESLEKIYKLMNDQIRTYESLPSISKEEKMELNDLKLRVKNVKDEYKKKHKSFFGKLYLIVKGFFNGGHINDLSLNLSQTIDRLIAKPLTPNIEDLDTFLNLVAPKMDEMGLSLRPGVFDRKWIYYPETGVIQDIEYDTEATLPQGSEELSLILEKINEQLSAFDTLEEVTRAQKLQIEKLKVLVINRALQQELNASSVTEKIDRLLQLPEAQNESDEKIKAMLEHSNKVCEELLETEKGFLASVDQSVKSLKQLQTLKSQINYGSQYLSFFEGKEKSKATLENCIEAFTLLKDHTTHMVNAIESAVSEEAIENRNTEISRIYKSELFTNYAKQMSVCARYYTLLSGLDVDLKKKNPKDGALKVYFNGNKGMDPMSFYITTVQRLPRHQMLMFDLTKNTPGHLNEFRNVYDAYIKALSHSANLDKRMHYPFHV